MLGRCIFSVVLLGFVWGLPFALTCLHPPSRELVKAECCEMSLLMPGGGRLGVNLIGDCAIS
eukprot:3467326-Amphidinium_carterae.1